MAAVFCPWYFYFNPRSPQGERQFDFLHVVNMENFNPRSPQGERLFTKGAVNIKKRFQSTLPAGGATPNRCAGPVLISYFNPRSPQGERPSFSIVTRGNSYFNPRSPQGERHLNLLIYLMLVVFQSTLPAGGATDEAPAEASLASISIHAPRRGSDSTVKAYSNDRIKRSTLREPHFLYSKNACFSPIFSMCATTSRTKNQRIRVSFGSYPGLAPTCFTLAWYRFPRL